MKIFLAFLLIVLLGGCGSTSSDETDTTSENRDTYTTSTNSSNSLAESSSMKETSETKVTMSIGNQNYLVTLNDSQAAKDFYELLPLTLNLEDYNQTEKIADLPKALDTSDSPAGTDAQKGDISFYAPWGNLAIFYQDFGYGQGLVNLGKIDEGSDMLTNQGASFEVTFKK